MGFIHDRQWTIEGNDEYHVITRGEEVFALGTTRDADGVDPSFRGVTGRSIVDDDVADDR